MPTDNGYQYQTRTLQLPAGERQPIDALDFFVLLSGSGLQVLTRGREGLPMDLPPRLVLGDGRSGKLGILILYNPTGSAVTAQYVTSNRELTLTPLGSIQDVNVVSVGGTASQRIEGTEADGAAASARPVQTGGRDGSGNVQAHLVDTLGRAAVVGAADVDAAAAGAPVSVGGRAAVTNATVNVSDGDAQRIMVDWLGRVITVADHPRELDLQDAGTLTAAPDVEVFPAQTGNLLVHLCELVLTEMNGSASVVEVKSGATVLFTVSLAMNETKHLSFRRSVRCGVTSALNLSLASGSDVDYFAVAYVSL